MASVFFLFNLFSESLNKFRPLRPRKCLKSRRRVSVTRLASDPIDFGRVLATPIHMRDGWLLCPGRTTSHGASDSARSHPLLSLVSRHASGARGYTRSVRPSSLTRLHLARTGQQAPRAHDTSIEEIKAVRMGQQ
jgi:hypothetical protein